MDADGDGYLSKDEFKLAMAKRNPPLNSEQDELAFAGFDTNKDGKISEAEFVSQEDGHLPRYALELASLSGSLRLRSSAKSPLPSRAKRAQRVQDAPAGLHATTAAPMTPPAPTGTLQARRPRSRPAEGGGGRAKHGCRAWTRGRRSAWGVLPRGLLGFVVFGARRSAFSFAQAITVEEFKQRMGAVLVEDALPNP